MKIYSKTDIGLKRDQNQDCVWSEMLTDGACAAVLCDGMGGETHGELASSMAVEIISRRIRENFSELMSRNTVRNLLITAVSAANSAVSDESARNFGAVMGTTCVAAIVSGGRAYIVNVGDSRCYHLFSSEDSDCIQQVTRDHSHVQDLVDRGEITAEQARNHPDRSKITRAIGAESLVTPDYYEVELGGGEMLLLCSDGLSSYVDDMDILDICYENPAGDICGALIDRANESGGHDNISVALAVM